MNNSEFLSVLEYLEHERGIDRETLIALIEESLSAAAQKVVHSEQEVRVRVNRSTGEILCWAPVVVVKNVHNSGEEVSLADARKLRPDVSEGDEIEWEVTPKDFGRIAAQTMKQTLMYGIRQAEKLNICEDFKDQLNQLITGVVRRVEHGDVYIDFHQAEGVMRYNDRIPGEEYHPGEHITAILLEINADHPGPSLIVSRSNPELVRVLFEREVSEITDSLVEIKVVAREAGYRTKIAVHTEDGRIDPVGACVGLRGNRVKTVVRELGGEKVDIIRWDSDVKTFVSNALQPAKLSGVTIDEEAHTVHVVAPEDQLSLAIGRKGQNARLAAKLTGWRIDINKHEQVKRAVFEDKIQHAIDALARIPGIGEEVAPVLVQSGFLSLEGIMAAEAEDLATLDGIDIEQARQVIGAAKEQLGA